MRTLLLAALLAVALPASADAQEWVIPAPSADTLKVSTQGMAEIPVPATRATALFVLGSEGASVAEVAATTAALRSAATAALGSLGMGPSSYELVSFGAGPTAGAVRARAPGQPVPPALQEAKAALRVVIDPVSRLDEVVAAVLGAGAESVINVTFDADEDPAVRRHATELAMSQARAEAEAVAQATGMRLGRVLMVSSSPDFLRQNILSNTMIRTSVSQGIPLIPSDVTVRVNIQVVWEMLPG